jgi:carbon storage regulator CsrA
MTLLVLTRKIGEQIQIQLDDETSMLITVKSINRNQVRLLLEAPKKVRIERPERNNIDLDY